MSSGQHTRAHTFPSVKPTAVVSINILVSVGESLEEEKKEPTARVDSERTVWFQCCEVSRDAQVAF